MGRWPAPTAASASPVVPAVLIYPRHHRANRVGVVDWVDSAFFISFRQPPSSGHSSSRCSRRVTTCSTRDTRTSRFNGTRRSPKSSGRPPRWTVCPTTPWSTAPSIAAPRFELGDPAGRGAPAGRIRARLPDSNGPRPVETVLSSGYSQGAGAQLELLAEGLDPHLVYDGHLDPDDRARVLTRTARRCRAALRLPRRLQSPSDEWTTRTGHRARDGVRHGHLPPDRFSGSGRVPSSPAIRPIPTGASTRWPGYCASAGANPAARRPQPEHRRRAADFPRRPGEPDPMDDGQTPRATPPPSRYFKGNVDANAYSCRRRMPMAILREASDCRTSSRHCTGDPPARRSVVTRRSTQSASIRSTRRVHQRDLHALQRRGAAGSVSVAGPVHAADHARRQSSVRTRLHHQRGPDGAHRRRRMRATAGGFPMPKVTANGITMHYEQQGRRRAAHPHSLPGREYLPVRVPGARSMPSTSQPFPWTCGARANRTSRQAPRRSCLPTMWRGSCTQWASRERMWPVCRLAAPSACGSR